MNIVRLLIFSLTLLASSLGASSLLYSSIPFKEAKITYQLSGNISGRQTTYIKDYGKKIATYTTINSKIMSQDHTKRSLTIIDKDTKTTINLSNHTAIQTSTLKSSLLQYFRYLDTKDQEYILSSPSSEVAGVECEKISYDGKKLCLNGSLVLESDVSIFGYSEHIKAIKIEKMKVNEKLFTLPYNLDIKKEDEDFNQIKKLIESMLE